LPSLFGMTIRMDLSAVNAAFGGTLLKAIQ
jgi:hypothetical protein